MDIDIFLIRRQVNQKSIKYFFGDKRIIDGDDFVDLKVYNRRLLNQTGCGANVPWEKIRDFRVKFGCCGMYYEE